MNRIWIILIVLSGFASCSSKEPTLHPDVAEKGALNELNQSADETVDEYDGFYLDNWNNSGVLVIYKGKIHHYSRQQSTSIYKDEEYDFTTLEDGFLLINRNYRLDRNDQVVSKETILKDIRPVLKSGQVIALERNGRTFERMENFGMFLSKFGWNIEHFIKDYSEKWNMDLEQIRQAVVNRNFYKTPLLVSGKLRDGEISFEEMLKSIVDSFRQ